MSFPAIKKIQHLFHDPAEGRKQGFHINTVNKRFTETSEKQKAKETAETVSFVIGDLHLPGPAGRDPRSKIITRRQER